MFRKIPTSDLFLNLQSPPLNLNPNLLTCILLSVLLAGCHSQMIGSGFSSNKILASDTLRIHTDFVLPEDHPLIVELGDQKQRLAQRTGLTFSAAKVPIDVYLFRDRDSFNQFTSKSNAAFARRRAFFVKGDSMLNVYAVWGDRAAEDLRHEVTHGYLHSVAPSIPLWIDEGLAEYFEVGPGTGGLNWAHVQHLLDAFEQETWTPSLGRMESLYDPLKLDQTDYAEAWLWTHFLLSEDSTAALVRSQMQRYQNKTGVAWTAKVHHLVHDPNQRLLEHLKALQ